MELQFLDLMPSLTRFLPEIALVVVALLVVILDCIPVKAVQRSVGLVTLVGLGVTAALTWCQYDCYIGENPDGGMQLLFSGTVGLNGFTIFLKMVFCVVGIIITLISRPIAREKGFGEGEYFGLMLTCIFGMFVLASSTDLLLMWLALETVSIPSYVMTGFLRGDRKSKEAALKYVIFGSVAAGTMVYGISLIYGATGHTNLFLIADYLAVQGTAVNPIMLFVGFIMTLAGIGYKIAAVPFHSWCPDAYEGAPTPFTAFMSVGPKAAGFGALAMLLFCGFSTETAGVFVPAFESLNWPLMIGFIAVLTMTVGNFGALWQQNLKRLFAYSSIAHAGYMMMALVLGTSGGLEAVLFYLAVYLFMNLGMFMAVIVLEEKYGVTTVDECAGLGLLLPGFGVCVVVFLASLTGLPPLAGFIGKFYIFAELVRSGQNVWIVLALIGGMNGVVAAYYYFRVFKSMYFKKREEGLPAPDPVKASPLTVLMVAMAVMTFVLGVAFNPLKGAVEEGARGFAYDPTAVIEQPTSDADAAAEDVDDE
jgi:NADH-quinone oxidoreductase subunit N